MDSWSQGGSCSYIMIHKVVSNTLSPHYHSSSAVRFTCSRALVPRCPFSSDLQFHALLPSSILAMATDSLNLEALAESCLQSAKTINAFLNKDDGHDRLAFDPLALPAFPKCDEATELARTNLRNAARTMYDLATGPEQYLVESSLISVSTAKGAKLTRRQT